MFHRHMFFGEPWREHRFQKGDLKYIILDLVKDKPRYGYEVIRALEERSHGFYAPSPGTVYPTLQMLEEMSYVISEQRDGKKVYTITEEGLNYLKKQEEFTEEIKSQMHDWWNPDEIKEIKETMQEFGRLARMVSRQARKVSPDKMRRIRQVISSAGKDIDKILSD